MNLNKLKPAWRQFQIVSDLRPFTENELLAILNDAERISAGKINRSVLHALTFLVLILFCQGG